MMPLLMRNCEPNQLDEDNWEWGSIRFAPSDRYRNTVPSKLAVRSILCSLNPETPPSTSRATAEAMVSEMEWQILEIAQRFQTELLKMGAPSWHRPATFECISRNVRTDGSTAPFGSMLEAGDSSSSHDRPPNEPCTWRHESR